MHHASKIICGLVLALIGGCHEKAPLAPISEGDGFPAGSCVLTSDGEPRTVFQCNGALTVSIAFQTALGDCQAVVGKTGWCEESHEFGVGFESYEIPAVMACCDAEDTPLEAMLAACSSDLVEQLCRSIPARIDLLIESGKVQIVLAQVKKLRDWISEHQQQCYAAFHQSAVVDSLAPISWLVNDGNHKQWPSLKNLTITIESAVLESVTLPADQHERLDCYDNNLNNDEVFVQDQQQ